MRLATWNVNSVRTRTERVIRFLERQDIDVLAIQETKCRPEQFPYLPFEAAGYEVAVHGLDQWNGVAIASRVGLSDVVTSFPGQPTWVAGQGKEPVVEARALGATVGGALGTTGTTGVARIGGGAEGTRPAGSAGPVTGARIGEDSGTARDAGPATGTRPAGGTSDTGPATGTGSTRNTRPATGTEDGGGGSAKGSESATTPTDTARDGRATAGSGDSGTARDATATGVPRPVRLWSLYVPNGRELTHPHYAYKLEWLARLRDAVGSWLEADPDLPLALVGDWNVAPRDEDVWDVSAFAGATHVSAPEREAFAAFESVGMSEVTRPHVTNYTFWDYQRLRFPRNEGMRIDFAYASPALAARVVGAAIDRDERKGKGASDHVPVVVELS